MSNKWLIDVVDTAFLTHDLNAPAIKWNYRSVQCEITGIAEKPAPCTMRESP